MRQSILFILFTGVLLAGAPDQKVTFTASVDRNRVEMGIQFQLTFTLEGATGGSSFRPPPFNDFLVLSGPNQSTQMNFINGAMSSSVSYSYVLQPRSEGKFTIGAATIVVGGKTVQSQPLALEVVKGSSRPAQQPGKQQEETDIGRQIGDNLFLKVEVDRARTSQGEQITAIYKIYTRVNVVNYSVSKVPSLSGFWSEDLEVPRQIQLTNETVNGKQYKVAVLKKTALFPQRSGMLELDPMEVNCVVQVQTRRRSNDLIDQFFNDPFFGNVSNVNHKVASQPVKITVLPLPAEDVPAGFNGAVGKYTMEAWLDKKETKANEPVTLKVKITGRGNLKLIQPPALAVTSDIEKYDPKIYDNITHEGDRVAGSRSFEYLLIPRHAGDQKIPPLAFSFYDVEKKSYVTLTSPEFALSVGKGTELASAPSSGLSKEDVKLIGEDIRFIKSGAVSIARRGGSFAGSPVFFALSAAPVLAFIGFVFYQRRREKILGDVAGLRHRKARKMAQKRLVTAKDYLVQNRKEEFYGEVSRALWGYISDKLGIPPAELSLDAIRAALEGRGVKGDVVTSLSGTLEQCEFARFAPAADPLGMDTMYRQAVELISTIEGQLR